MTAHKTADLTEALLDVAVGFALGLRSREPLTGLYLIKRQDGKGETLGLFEPSTNWQDGGPIIEREGILVAPKRAEWRALCGPWDVTGPTPLVAAMRAYVARKFGETMELP